MNCPSCRQENSEGTKFCGECGAPFTNRYPKCGIDNPPRFKFCGGCGQALTAFAAALGSSAPVGAGFKPARAYCKPPLPSSAS